MNVEPLSRENLAEAHRVLAQLRTELSVERLEGFIDDDLYEFRVYREAEVVAVCGFRMLETITRHFHCHIHDLVVDESARGSGLGRAVIDEMRAHAAERGARWLFLDGIDAALGFYERLGFERHAATLLKLPVAPESR